MVPTNQHACNFLQLQNTCRKFCKRNIILYNPRNIRNKKSHMFVQILASFDRLLHRACEKTFIYFRNNVKGKNPCSVLNDVKFTNNYIIRSQNVKVRFGMSVLLIINFGAFLSTKIKHFSFIKLEI